ncbi:MAG: DUF1987 domain-containing protein [Bacteroidales bacterium]|nr:DUF1987 domain-containing protein [Bacteroidales bacterium]
MMKIIIPAGNNTAEIAIDNENLKFIMRGSSAPENPVAYFENINQKLKEFCENNPKNKTIRFDLVYFNSSSAKFIFLMLKSLTQYNNIKIEWVYEDGDFDMQEAGEEYQKITGLDFEYFVKEENE